MKFKAGDIIRGTEGNGKTWGNTTTLLILYFREDQSVSAVVLNSFSPITGKKTTHHIGSGGWTLSCRDWEKIGVVEEVADAQEAIAEAKASYSN